MNVIRMHIVQPEISGAIRATVFVNVLLAAETGMSIRRNSASPPIRQAMARMKSAIAIVGRRRWIAV